MPAFRAWATLALVLLVGCKSGSPAPRAAAAPSAEEGNDVASLNNRAHALIANKELAAAESTLAHVRRILDGRPPSRDAQGQLQAMIDEYFYRCGTARLAWVRQRYPVGLPEAERAWHLEKAIRAAAVGHHPPLEIYFSFGSWAYISFLTRGQRYEDAFAAFDEVLSDRAVFASRLAQNRDDAEHVLLAGLCLFFEAKTPSWLERGRALLPRVQSLVPAPVNSDLAFAYACMHARSGESEQALDALDGAVAHGLNTSVLLSDDDLRSLWTHPRFRTLLEATELKTARGDCEMHALDSGVRRLAAIHAVLRDPDLIFEQARCYGRSGFYEAAAVERYEEFLRQTPDKSSKHAVEASARLSEIARRAAEDRVAAEDSTRSAADPAAQAHTRDFLGPETSWDRVRMEAKRVTTYGLGSLAMRIEGNGRGEVCRESFPDRAVSCKAFDMGRAEARRLLLAFIESGFAEFTIAQKPGQPDEIIYTMALVNPSGEARKFGKFVSNKHLRFDALLIRVGAVVSGALDPETRKRMFGE
jgi:hypothetical protein